MDHDPDFDRLASKQPPRRTNWLIRLLGYGALVLLLIALLLPTRRSGREAARRSQCVNNLKQIGLALANYEDRYGVLPPAYTVDSDGRPLHSWRTLILPFLEFEEAYRRIDLSKPWDDPGNVAAVRDLPATVRTVDRAGMTRGFGCPSAVLEPGLTTYLAVTGPDAAFLPGRGRERAEITSDPGSVQAVIEVDAADAVPWMAPRDADAARLARGDFKAGSQHPGGANVAHLDGSVEFLKATTPLAVVRELISISRPAGSSPAR